MLKSLDKHLKITWQMWNPMTVRQTVMIEVYKQCLTNSNFFNIFLVISILGLGSSLSTLMTIWGLKHCSFLLLEGTHFPWLQLLLMTEVITMVCVCVCMGVCLRIPMWKLKASSPAIQTQLEEFNQELLHTLMGHLPLNTQCCFWRGGGRREENVFIYVYLIFIFMNVHI